MFISDKAQVCQDKLDYLFRFKMVSEDTIKEFNDILLRSDKPSNLTLVHRLVNDGQLETRVDLVDNQNNQGRVLITDVVMASTGHIFGFVNGYVYYLRYEDGDIVVGKRYRHILRRLEDKASSNFPLVAFNIFLSGRDERLSSTDAKTARIIEEEGLGIMSDDYVRCK